VCCDYSWCSPEDITDHHLSWKDRRQCKNVQMQKCRNWNYFGHRCCLRLKLHWGHPWWRNLANGLQDSLILCTQNWQPHQESSRTSSICKTDQNCRIHWFGPHHFSFSIHTGHNCHVFHLLTYMRHSAIWYTVKKYATFIIRSKRNIWKAACIN